MTPDAPPLIALTMGEPGGIGAEITIDAWRRLRNGPDCFLAIDDPARLAALGAPVTEIARPAEARAAFATAIPVLAVGRTVVATPGVAAPENADAVIRSIERAVDLALCGEVAAMVTNPIQKSSLMAAGFKFPGHTEFIESLVRDRVDPAARAVMMLASPSLRTVPVTIHRSVRDAASSLTTEMIFDISRRVSAALIRDFAIAEPRLCISGLNPHAGEGGKFGREDVDVIAPAVAALRASGVNAVGPAPADTMFHREARAQYDAAICMLHDQALIPVKTLHFDEAVNVTLGLPLVRTSPDHGTALDIAGKGRARAESLIAAISLARDIARARAT